MKNLLTYLILLIVAAGCGGDYIPTTYEQIFLDKLSDSLNCSYHIEDLSVQKKVYLKLNFSESDSNWCLIDDAKFKRLGLITAKHFVRVFEKADQCNEIIIKFDSSEHPNDRLEVPTCGKKITFLMPSLEIIDYREDVIK